MIEFRHLCIFTLINPSAYLAELWVFQEKSKRPSELKTQNTNLYQLDASKSTTELDIMRFSVASVRVPGQLTSLEYQINSEQHCLDLQIFFARDAHNFKLFLKASYTELALTTNPNDLGTYIQQLTLERKHDLSTRMAAFYQQLNLSREADIFLYLFCPFWMTSNQPTHLRVRFEYSKTKLARHSVHQANSERA